MNTHIINKQIIDLKIPSEENAFGLQQEVRDAYINNVLPLISEVLDEFAGPDEVLRIDRLELDFGTLKRDKIGLQMKERVREAILKQLPALKQKTIAGKESFSILESVVDGKRTKAQLMNESFSQRELLEIFFETGLLPWWSPDEIDAPDIDAIMIDLLEKEPAATLQWLQQLAVKSPAAIQRMTMQVDKSTQKSILAAFPEKIIASVRVLAKQLQEIQTSVDYFSPFPGNADPVLFAALTLAGEVLQSQQEITTRKVLEKMITKLAIIHNVPGSEIQKQLYTDTLTGIISSDSKKTTLPDVVEYFIEWEKQHPEAASSITGNQTPVLEAVIESEAKSISELVDAIEQALKAYEEKQSFFQKSRRKPLRKIAKQSKKQDVQEQETDEGSEILLNHPAVQSTIDTNTVSEIQDGLKEITEEADPINEIKALPAEENPEQITPAAEENYAVKINWFKAKSENDVPEKIPGKIESVPGASAPENKAVITEEKKTEVISPKEEKAATTDAILIADEIKPAEKSISEQVDEFMEADAFNEEHPLLKKKKPSAGMTRFGGLVLIAPFLPAFFAELRLVEDGKFTSEAEQHKAIHLLNFLATGKTSSPEYALLLHKLLCGIELTQAVPKTVKLSVAEKKEAMLFLDDIAGQWTALRSTSGQAFRDTFFRRNGILEQKENLWLLRVERGPMDIMLDTLPWTTSIIKAPWMQQLLQVEW
jgi:hypothetical protein